jgi:hypothetical protein
MNYQQIKNQQAPLKDCFFAFSKEQYNEGIAKHNLEGKKIFSAFGGLYGTKEGIDELMNFYDELNKRIGKECDPQEVYNYEYDNYECSITCDDSEAMMMALGYFTEEQCRKIKRKYGYLGVPIEELILRMAKEVS